MAWTLYKEIKYALDGIPAENLTDFPKLVSVVADADIASELSGGGGIKFTSADGLTDLAFGLYPTSDLASGTVLARIKLTLLTAASVGDVICRLYYSSTEATTENKSGTVSNSYTAFMPLEEDPSGSAPQMLDWVSNTKTGTSAGSMTSGDLVAGQVGNGLAFDGSNDRVDISASVSGSAITVELAANYNSALGSGSKHAIDFGTGTPRIVLRCSNNDWFVRDASGDTVSCASVGVQSGVMKAYSLTINGATSVAFANGSQVATNTNASYALPTFSAFAIGLGGAIAFGGVIDELRISSVARSANWLAYAYADDFDNSGTFTLSAEQGGGGGSSVSLSPVSINWSVVSPATKLSRSITPVSVEWTPQAPGTQIIQSFSPVSVAWNPVAVNTIITAAIAPAAVEWVTVTPQTSLSASVALSPVSVEWLTVTPETDLSVTITPVTIAWTPVVAFIGPAFDGHIYFTGETMRKPSVTGEFMRKPSVSGEVMRKPSVTNETMVK